MPDSGYRNIDRCECQREEASDHTASYYAEIFSELTESGISEARDERDQAATIRQKGGPFQVEKLYLDEPRPDEVLVRVVAAGMCHTDMVARDQLYECRCRSCSGMKARAWWSRSAAV